MLAIKASSLEGQQECKRLPEATTFCNSSREIAKCFIKNNPWKLSVHNSEQKIYRFCIICGDERFSDEKWSKLIDILGPPTICDKGSCRDALDYVWGVIPRKHFTIIAKLDESRVKAAKRQEFFEEI